MSASKAWKAGSWVKSGLFCTFPVPGLILARRISPMARLPSPWRIPTVAPAGSRLCCVGGVRPPDEQGGLARQELPRRLLRPQRREPGVALLHRDSADPGGRLRPERGELGEPARRFPDGAWFVNTMADSLSFSKTPTRPPGRTTRTSSATARPASPRWWSVVTARATSKVASR